MTLASAPFVYYITDGVAVVGLVGRRGLQTGTSSDFSMPIFLDEHVPRGPLFSSHAHICMGMVWACMQKDMRPIFLPMPFDFSILFVLM